ncbi:unnamed protein product [Moneuplotes crassus]|uniref:AAA+ ATPase domain-containing protein n=1 Tax=Euplotes crassus TaxID=5936 RepID=A0AAD1XG07_EUPCR|nr:unnamed protein product [Moneuplotes crassus]
MDAFLKRKGKKAPKKIESKSKPENTQGSLSTCFGKSAKADGYSSKDSKSSNSTLIKTRSKIPAIEDVEMEVEDESKTRYQPWVEKYRPNKIDEVSHQSEVVSALSKSVETGKVPHLLLYGPPGTGKTSTILALSKELFGPKFYRSRILELNASDDRGIGMVREKIKKFAQKKIAKAVDSEYPCPPVQLIILDEADSMTVDAQSALRRTIEVYSAQTRFCIICNYVSKIIEPLASRCVKFRFTPISEEAQIKRLEYICDKEEIKHDPSALPALVEVTDGDMRKSIMMLQSAGRSYETEKLTADDIYEVSGKIPTHVIQEIWEQIANLADGDTDISELAENVIQEGFDIMQLLSQLIDLITQENIRSVSDLKKARIAEVCAETEFKLIKGGSEELNVSYLFMSIGNILSS